MLTRHEIKALVRTRIVTHEAKNNFQTPDREALVDSVADGLMDLQVVTAVVSEPPKPAWKDESDDRPPGSLLR